MRLEKWLTMQGISVCVFAQKISKDRSLVHKYIYEGVIPKHDVMVKIYRVTLGAVSANDFYRLSDKILDEDFSKSNGEVLHANSFR